MELEKDFERSYGTLHCPKAEPVLLRTSWTAVRKTAVLRTCNDNNSKLSLSNVFHFFTICTAALFFLMFNFNHLYSNLSPLFFVLSASGTGKRFAYSPKQPVLGLNTVNMLPPQIIFFFLGYTCPSVVDLLEMVMFSSFMIIYMCCYSWDYTGCWVSSLSQVTTYCQEQGRGHDHIIGKKVKKRSKAFYNSTD